MHPPAMEARVQSKGCRVASILDRGFVLERSWASICLSCTGARQSSTNCGSAFPMEDSALFVLRRCMYVLIPRCTPPHTLCLSRNPSRNFPAPICLGQIQSTDPFLCADTSPIIRVDTSNTSAADPLPNAPTKTIEQDVPASDIFAGKKVVVCGVPGAFTPTCDDNHLPSFIANADKFKVGGLARLDSTGSGLLFD